VKPNDSWKVLPHGEIEQLADNLYTVEGELPMPFGHTTRRMTIVRLAGNQLAIYSAIALDEVRMARLEALGKPRFLIVPSAIHRLDAKPWKARYPQLEVIAPAGARDKVSKVVAIDDHRIDPDLGDPRVEIDVVPGTGRQELAMIVETPTGKTLVVNDLIFNMPAMKGIAGLGLRLLGFGPGHPTMPKLVRMKLVKNEDQVKTQLREWAGLDRLERILVSHGAPIENPRETLLKLAA
jgi:hypothetical protein